MRFSELAPPLFIVLWLRRMGIIVGIDGWGRGKTQQFIRSNRHKQAEASDILWFL